MVNLACYSLNSLDNITMMILMILLFTNHNPGIYGCSLLVTLLVANVISHYIADLKRPHNSAVVDPTGDWNESNTSTQDALQHTILHSFIIYSRIRMWRPVVLRLCWRRRPVLSLPLQSVDRLRDKENCLLQPARPINQMLMMMTCCSYLMTATSSTFNKQYILLLSSNHLFKLYENKVIAI